VCWSDVHGCRRLVRMRTKQLARQAVVAAFLEGALNPPLEDPHRKMRLKTAHGWLPLRGPAERIADGRRKEF